MNPFLLSAVFISVTVMIIETGCGRRKEKEGEWIKEKASGSNTKVDIGAIDVSELPQYLHYPNAVVKGKFEIATEDRKGINWSFETPDSKEEVVTFYKNALLNWKHPITSETPEGTTMIFGSPDKREIVLVNVRKEGEGKTILNLTHIKK